jgi:murein DD-endopeptidase MepM/ murein hydrolase activator NlpD
MKAVPDYFVYKYMKSILRKLPTLILLLFILGAGIFFVSDYLEQPNNSNETEIQKPEEIKEELGVLISPELVIQGEPALVTVTGTTTVKNIKFNGNNLRVFEYEGKPSALIGIDLRMKTGEYPLSVELNDGTELKKTFVVSERKIAQAPLGIPDKLGGNTQESEQNLLNTLVEEGKIISAIPNTSEKLWTGKFRLPIDPPIVITDVYGYSRITGGSSISHKGTDFRAAVGTPVYAMNSGVVRLTREMRNYGKTVVVDHGSGIHTIYMHLSEINVGLGEKVTKGQLVGKSGDTGYVLGPHLHLTIRINGISIDPQKFMNIVGE